MISSCRKFRCLLPLAMLAGTLTAGLWPLPCTGMETIAELENLLQQHGIAMDTNAVEDAAIRGMLKILDPSARIVTEEEAESLRKEMLGLSAIGIVSTNAGGTHDAETYLPLSPIAVSEVRSNGIAYLKLRGLYSASGAEVAIQLLDLASKTGTCGIVFDIRGAGGNDLEAVGEIANLFEGSTNVLYRVQDGFEQEAVVLQEHPGGMRLRTPLMLLVDRRTTSASEVMAAVLNGRRGVMLIGSPTGGDNRLRELIPLSDGRLLCIASREIVLPDGSTYDLSGVNPNVVVRNEARAAVPFAAATNTPLASANAPGASERTEKDAVLDRAVDILLGLKALGVHAAGQTANPKD